MKIITKISIVVLILIFGTGIAKGLSCSNKPCGNKMIKNGILYQKGKESAPVYDKPGSNVVVWHSCGCPEVHLGKILFETENYYITHLGFISKESLYNSIFWIGSLKPSSTFFFINWSLIIILVYFLYKSVKPVYFINKGVKKVFKKK